TQLDALPTLCPYPTLFRSSAIMRYVAGRPFSFTEELVGVLFITMSFLSLPIVLCDNMHVNITLFTDRYSLRWKVIAALFADAIRSEEHTSELQSRENLVCR